MSPSELLRKFADMIDAKYQDGGMNHEMPSDYESEEDDAGCGCENDNGLANAPDDIFVPPLQMKLELLKKATGVDNIYDNDDEDDPDHHHYNELEIIKKNAGINPVVLDALGDDEPLDV